MLQYVNLVATKLQINPYTIGRTSCFRLIPSAGEPFYRSKGSELLNTAKMQKISDNILKKEPGKNEIKKDQEGEE